MHCFDTHVSNHRATLSLFNDNSRDLEADIRSMTEPFICCDVEYPGRYRHANVARHHLTHGSRKLLKKRLHKAERQTARIEIKRELEAIADDQRKEEQTRYELDDWELDRLEWEAEERRNRKWLKAERQATREREIEAAYLEDETGKVGDPHAVTYDYDYDEYVYDVNGHVAYA